MILRYVSIAIRRLERDVDGAGEVGEEVHLDRGDTLLLRALGGSSQRLGGGSVGGLNGALVELREGEALAHGDVLRIIIGTY